MKLGIFIAVVVCAVTPALADTNARIDGYRKAYGESADPHLLVLIANEYRDAGSPRDALAYYCSYIYTAPSGDDADLASAQLHALRPDTESDHDACKSAPAPRVIEIQLAVPVVAPPITKREVAGLAGMAIAVASLGFALYEGNQLASDNRELDALDPMATHPASTAGLEARAAMHASRENWFLAGAGVAMVAGGVLYLTGRHDRHKAEAALVAPTITKNGAGVTLSGSF
ncbi:MAG: hypothetical protein JO257_14330 [Deltaproteobacteria bacterium]|nr:hypothetical protein [Deltaproteobacteria bacterium]